MSEMVNDAVAELRSVGIEPTVEHGGKHYRIHWTHNGQHRALTVAVSPSDWRAPLNNRSQIRAILKRDGLLDEAPPVEGAHVLLRNGAAFCTSLDVSKHFHKAHKDVLRNIDRICEETGAEFNQRNFAPIEYLDARGRAQRAFELTRDGFSLLAMGFTGPAAMEWKIKYLDAFNQMEAEIHRVSAAQTVPDDVLMRIEKIEDDLNALIDLSLAAPKPEPGYIVVRAYKRKQRGYAQ